MLFHQNYFIIFGGKNGLINKKLSTIAKYNDETDEWSKLGKLGMARESMGVIYDGASFVVVGGRPGKDYERCTLVVRFPDKYRENEGIISRYTNVQTTQNISKAMYDKKSRRR